MSSLLLQKDGQSARQAFDTKQIVSIRRYLDLVDGRVLLVGILLDHHVVQLDAELEAQMVELFFSFKTNKTIRIDSNAMESVIERKRGKIDAN